MAKRTREKFEEERKQPPLRPLTDNQAGYIAALSTHSQTVVMGPAGTGKTYIPSIMAADGLRNHRIGKIVLTRPNVSCGKSLGFFPGTLEEKIAPWVAEFTSVISERMTKGAFDVALKRGDIEIVPFEVMRGRTFNNAFIILDEAQNTTPEEMKMFLTRIGKQCTVVINGDVSQSDIPTKSGLHKVLTMVRSQSLPVPVVEFTEDDIVRSGECAMWVRAFHRDGI